MASSKDYLEFVLEQLSELQEITYRAMMGEFIIYYRGKIVGGIYDDRLLVKPTKSAISYMPTVTYEIPYENAKEMLLVEEVDNKGFLTGLFDVMYVRFVDREDDKPKSQWKTNDDWAWFVGENREPIRLTTKPEPYTLQKALHWLQRQVAPTIKMVQALDEENHTTILKDMIEQAELKDKHKHLLQLEKSTIEERIDTAVPQENDGIF